MGIGDWLGGRGMDHEIQEMMNPLLAWRLQHFVAFPRSDDGYVKHYFQFLDKERVRVEFILFYHETMGGLAHECTAYRKYPEESYGLLNERGPWSMSITFLIELGRTLPTNTQPIEGHHVNGVSVGSRRRGEAAKAIEKANTAPVSPYKWERTRPPAPESDSPEDDEPVLDGFVIGEIIQFKPFRTLAKIVSLEPFDDSIYGDTHRFVLEFEDYEADLRVPVSRLRDLIDLGLDEESTDDEVPVTERHGFSVGEHVVYPSHGVGKILAIENKDTAGSKLEVFVIHFKNGDMILRVPTGKHASVGMRRLEDEL